MFLWQVAGNNHIKVYSVHQDFVNLTAEQKK
jgi:hypothetical protein